MVMWRRCHRGGFLKLTKKEIDAISSLKSLEKRWPKTLWLFAGGSSISIMRCGPDGEHVTLPGYGGMDPSYRVDSVDIDNDGGDW
jgi:hypothetical protein